MQAAQAAAVGAQGPLVSRECPGCGGSARRALGRYSRAPWTIVQCTDCRFVFLADAPGYDRLVEEFAWEKSYPEERLRRRRSRPVSYWTSQALRLFHRVGSSRRTARALRFAPGAVLDVGCGSSTKVPARNTPYGIEISRALHATADEIMRRRGGHAVHAPAIEGIGTFPDGFFVGAILSSYLEHEIRPGELLRELGRVVRPGGLVYVRVPNYGSVNRMVRGAQWAGIRLPDHVNYFTVGSLKRLAAAGGFEVRLLNPIVIPFDDNINAMLVRR